MDKTLFSMGGMVVLSEAMAQNCLYQIRVDKMNRSWNSTHIMYYGVTGTHPSNLKIQEHMYQTDFIIVKRLGDSTASLEEGNVIGLIIDSSNDLHLYLNGEDLGVTEKSVPRPCYAAFDLNRRVVKVTALPV
ncbi:neuralized-like protein 4 [Pomacea canaliculata]|uniref:neuralized-like protein 4 n=1 Tax=Pomacea canaliculata TaxID=400727 RepID=UPI000D725FFA|nr:neuralized-like protein 4 [Pomacea canaliculata]